MRWMMCLQKTRLQKMRFRRDQWFRICQLRRFHYSVIVKVMQSLLIMHRMPGHLWKISFRTPYLPWMMSRIRRMGKDPWTRFLPWKVILIRRRILYRMKAKVQIAKMRYLWHSLSRRRRKRIVSGSVFLVM